MELGTQVSRVRALLSLVIFAILVVSCGGNDEPNLGPDADEEVAEVIAPTATPLSGPPVLGEIVWSLAVDPETKEPVEPVSSFSVDADVITAVAAVERLPQGTQLVGQWEYNNTSLDDFVTTITVDQDRVDGWIEFRLIQSDLERWPDGRYELSILSGGELLQSAEVQVR
jgi:hypothetical protein